MNCNFDVKADEARTVDEVTWERTPEGQLADVRKRTGNTDFARLEITSKSVCCDSLVC